MGTNPIYERQSYKNKFMYLNRIGKKRIIIRVLQIIFFSFNLSIRHFQ